MVFDRNTACPVSTECGDNSVTSTASLMRSTGILFGVLSMSIFGMGVWFDSLQIASEVSPISSLKWVDGSDVSVSVLPVVVFDGKEISVESTVQSQDLGVQLRWIENRLLEEDIEQQTFPTKR